MQQEKYVHVSYGLLHTIYTEEEITFIVKCCDKK